MRLAIAILVFVLGGCATETRILTPPLMSRIPGATTSSEFERPAKPGEQQGLGPASSEKTLLEKPDGSKYMVAHNGRELMLNILKCFEDDLPEIFVRDVLCAVTKAEYADRGIDPVEAYHTLRKRKADIMLLFERIPGGEFTPGMLVQTVGRNMFRLELTGKFTTGLPYTGMDMAFENGNYKLRWFLGR